MHFSLTMRIQFMVDGQVTEFVTLTKEPEQVSTDTSEGVSSFLTRRLHTSLVTTLDWIMTLEEVTDTQQNAPLIRLQEDMNIAMVTWITIATRMDGPIVVIGISVDGEQLVFRWYQRVKIMRIELAQKLSIHRNITVST